MTNAVIIGVTLSIAGVIGGFVCFILCKVYRKQKHRQNIPSYTGYDAVGDYKPPSLMSISTASQEAFFDQGAPVCPAVVSSVHL